MGRDGPESSRFVETLWKRRFNELWASATIGGRTSQRGQDEVCPHFIPDRYKSLRLTEEDVLGDSNFGYLDAQREVNG